MTRTRESGEKGTATIIALGFIALAVPLVTAALGLASTLSLDSRVKAGITKSQYSLIAAGQDVIHRILYEPGFADGLQAGVEYSYPVTINGSQVTVTLVKVIGPPGNPPPPSADNSRRLQTAKTVTPVIAAADTLSTFTYAISMQNSDDTSETLRQVYDGLPPGFSYVAASTSGVTSQDPLIEVLSSGPGGPSYQKLTWDLASLGISLQPLESTSLSFSAQASVAEGVYCNVAWADPGGKKTGTGPTAKITVGSPLVDRCPGVASKVTKTVSPAVAPANSPIVFTYTVVIENVGTADLTVSLIRDLLPQGFFYRENSTGGDITLVGPAATMFQGRQRLDWSFAQPVHILPGEVRTLIFDSDATVAPGDYWNEVWVSTSEFAYPIYSWPTALVKVMGVFQTTATDGGATATSELWVGLDSYVVAQWSITR